MVEYAVLLASNSFHELAGGLGDLASGVNWHGLGYAVFGLAALWIASRAFRPMGR